MNTKESNINMDFDKSRGLIPVIVQDINTQMVLMQAFMNREALDVTQKTGKLTFFSRSKKRLWTKGETSGNYLMVKALLPDCDNDCLLAMVEPSGPACHTGSVSCFFPDTTKPRTEDAPGQPTDSTNDAAANGAFLQKLENLLRSRIKEDVQKSYTARLFEAGPKRIAKKLGEEAVETALEAENGTTERLLEEAADLFYHLNVLLIARNLGFQDVINELEKRHKP